MEFTVIGINFRTAPVALREQVALSPEGVGSLLRTIRAERLADEALVLQTCNRTEFYLVNRQAADPLEHLLAHVARLNATPQVTDTAAFYRHAGPAAVMHLFRVAASLDSQIVGEDEILGQLKAAYRQALEARTARFFLNRLLHRAFRAGKRARTETELGRGSSSVPQAAVELARRLFTSLVGKTVLLIGAGETAERAARALVSCGAGRLIVANRTPARAQALASRLLKPPPEAPDLRPPEDGSVPRPASFGRATCQTEEDPSGQGPRVPHRRGHTAGRQGQPCPLGQEARADQPPFEAEAIGLERIPAVVTRCDLVIASTGAAEPVLTWEALAGPLSRLDHSLLIVDIAVPRDADPRLGRLSNVFLYNIDDLDRLVEENLARRQAEIPRAEAIVEWEAHQFLRWMDSLEVVPTIKLLQRRLEQLQGEQIERYGRRFRDADREALEQFAQGLSRRILHLPVAYLRHAAGNQTGMRREEIVELVRRLFDLDSLDQEP